MYQHKFKVPYNVSEGGFWIIFKLALVALLLAGAANSGAAFPSNDSNSTGKAGHPKMEQVLFQLAGSENPQAFAAQRGIDMVGDRVRVIIVLANEENISGRFNITIEVQDKNLVQALVPVGALLDMANETGIGYIKLPEKSRLMETEKPRQVSFPSGFSWVAVLVMFIFIKIRKGR